MRKLINILAFMAIFQTANGQDTLKRFELGSTLVTVNSFSTNFYPRTERAQFEFINGLFFRYTKKRLGLRVHTSYSDNSTSYDDTPISWDGSFGVIHNRDFRIGIGGQFSVFKRKEWLYTFLDISYRNVFSTGHYYGGFSGTNDRFSKTANGYDFIFGFGFKIKIIKNVYLSPEMGFNRSRKYVNTTVTSQYSGASSKHNYSNTELDPFLKLHLTVKF